MDMLDLQLCTNSVGALHIYSALAHNNHSN